MTQKDITQKLAAYCHWTGFPQFASECLQIVDKHTKRNIPFRFNRMQRYFFEVEKKRREAGLPLWFIILKIRQAGSTVYWTARMFHKARFNPNSTIGIVSHEDDSAKNLLNYIRFLKDNLPPWVRPLVKLDNRSELYLANPDPDGPQGMNSHIIVNCAKNTNLGASFSLSDLLFSECGRYDTITDTRQMYKTALQALPNSPESFLIKESTAESESGIGGSTFQDDWEEANEGKSWFDPHFISYIAVDGYRDEAKAEYERLEGMVELQESGDYGNEIEEAEFIRSEILKWYPEYDQHSIEGIESVETDIMYWICWRRFMIINKCNSNLKSFDEQYPITPERAFAASSGQVFDQKRLSVIIKGLKEDPGRPARYKFNTEMIEIGPNWSKFSNAFMEDTYGPLYIYEASVPGANYVIGADPAEGLESGDENCAVALKLPERIEVAHWCLQLDADLFGDLLYCLGIYYNKALLGVEMNSPGYTTVSRLVRDLKYPKERIWRNKKFDKVKVGKELRFGLFSNIAAKKNMINYLKAAIRDDLIEFRHLANVEEHRRTKQLSATEIKCITSRGEKRSPNRVIATAIANYMAEEFPNFVVREPEKIKKGSLKYWEKLIANSGYNDSFGDVPRW